MLYYLLCQDNNGYIHDARTTTWDSVGVIGATVVQADLVSKPVIGGTYTSSGGYVAPVRPVLKMSWSGDGTLDGDYYDLTADGTKRATLTATKWDAVSDAAMPSGSDVYRILVEGCPVSPSPAKLTLTNGSGSVSFTPAATLGGVAIIKLLPSDPTSPINETPIMLSVE